MDSGAYGGDTLVPNMKNLGLKKVILSYSFSLHRPWWARKPYQLFIFWICTNLGHLTKKWHLSKIVLETHMMVRHFNVHLWANALDSACLWWSGEISWLTPANILKRRHDLIYLLENLKSKIINLKIVEIEICTRLIFSKLSRSRSAQDSDLKIIVIETRPRLQFSRLLRPRLLEIWLKLSRLRFSETLADLWLCGHSQ